MRCSTARKGAALVRKGSENTSERHCKHKRKAVPYLQQRDVRYERCVRQLLVRRRRGVVVLPPTPPPQKKNQKKHRM